MLADTSLPKGLYDPESKIKNFKFSEDLNNIRLNLSGTGILYTDPSFHYYIGNGVEWRRPKEICNNPYFIKGKPDRTDVFQGKIGNCWFVASMEALTLNDELIKHVVPHDQGFDHDYIGAFHFRVWKLGTWYDVVVDDRIPVMGRNKKPVFSFSRSGDVFWACLLEKAYAKVSGCDTYDCLHGGVSTSALQDFSGGIAEEVYTHDPPRGTTIGWFVDLVYKQHALMCCRCFTNVQDSRSDLWARHAYSVTSVFKCHENDPTYPGLYLVRVMNPIDHEWTGDWSDNSRRWSEIDRRLREKLQVKKEDGEFWMELSDFVKYFEKIYVCHLGPGRFASSRREGDINTWKTSTFWGEWVKNVTAGGSSLSTRHENPQYTMEFDWIENDSNRDGYTSAVIELTHTSKEERRKKLNIRFYLYSLTNIQNLPKPLDQKFVQHYKAVNESDVDFSTGRVRTYVVRMKLVPGKYCIVPCTQEADEEAQFLLRVYSESRTEMWEYDAQVAATPPAEEEIVSSTDGGPTLHDLPDNQSEIDWISLKKILGKTTNKSLIAVIKSYLHSVWSILAPFLPHSYFGNFETREDVFSKTACRSMIAMLDSDHSGKLNVTEVNSLCKKISFWTKVYGQFADAADGGVPAARLRDALGAAGFTLNKRTLHVVIRYYADDQGRVPLSDFILCGVTLETGMSFYHKQRVDGEDKITLTLEEWVKNTLFL